MSKEGIRNSLSFLIEELLLSRLFPAGVFAWITLAKTWALIGRLQAVGSEDILSLPFLTYVAHQVLTILFMGIAVVLFFRRKPVVSNHSSLLNGVVALAGTFILMVPVGAKVDEDNTLALLASTTVMLFGVGLSVNSLLTLGRCFGLMPEARGLKTSGLYAWVRHPLYVSETITALGLVVGAASLPIVALFFVFCGLQYWRSANEEKALEGIFPEYKEYRRRTARFVPGVY